jgi:hypothetical protein
MLVHVMISHEQMASRSYNYENTGTYSRHRSTLITCATPTYDVSGRLAAVRWGWGVCFWALHTDISGLRAAGLGTGTGSGGRQWGAWEEIVIY